MDVQSTNAQSYETGSKSGATGTKSGSAAGSALAQLASSFANALSAAGAQVDSSLRLPTDTSAAETPRPRYDRADSREDAPVQENERPTHDNAQADDGYNAARQDDGRDAPRQETRPSQPANDTDGTTQRSDQATPADVGNDDAPNTAQNDTPDNDSAPTDTSKSGQETADGSEPGEDASAQAAAVPAAQTAAPTTAKAAFNPAHANLVEVAHSAQGGQAVREAAHAQVAATPGHIRQTQRIAPEHGGAAKATTGQQPAADAANAAPASSEGTQRAAAARAQSAQPTTPLIGNGGTAAQLSAATETAQGPDTVRAQQAAGLARAMGNTERVSVQVSVTDASASAQSRPTHTLSQALPVEVSHNAAPQDNPASPTAGRPSMAQIASGNTNPHAQSSAPDPAGNALSGPATQAAPQEFRAMMADGKGAARVGPASGQPTQAPVSTPETSSPSASGTTQSAPETNQATRTTAQPQTRPNLPARHVSEQVSVQINKAVKAGIDRINIQLKPASLGRIEVQLEMASSGRITAIVIADRPDTLDMLQRDSRGLEKSLQDAGLNLESGGMNFSLRGQQNNAGTNQGGGSGHGHGSDNGLPDEASDIADAATADISQQRAERAAVRGGVDVQA